MISAVRQDPYIKIGIVLFVFYIFQGLLNFQWLWLTQQQNNELFKVLTGIILLAYLTFQWSLFLLRATGRMHGAKRFYIIHKQVGAFAPVFFYLHATHLGYGMLGLLGITYFGNFLFALLNKDALSWKNKQLHVVWMVVHVSLSMVTTALALYHLIIAVTYH